MYSEVSCTREVLPEGRLASASVRCCTAAAFFRGADAYIAARSLKEIGADMLSYLFLYRENHVKLAKMG
jgi:hypothetical protein